MTYKDPDLDQVEQVTKVELEVEAMNMMNKLAIEGGGEGENRMPARRTHQTPCKGRRSTTTTWEGGALGGVEAGRSQRPATTKDRWPSSGGCHRTG